MNTSTTAREDESACGALRVWGAGCASASLVAWVAHVGGVLPMPFFLMFFGVPSVLLLFGLAALARWISVAVFTHSLRLGLVAGLVSTLAYDGVRLVIQAAPIFDYSAFRSIRIFGSWIADQPESAVAAQAAGWTYHFWNGVAFAIIFLLIFGRRPWYYGLAYGLVMELCMLGLFPFFLRVTDEVGFIVISLIGHAVYGAVLGLLAQRYALEWPGRRST